MFRKCSPISKFNETSAYLQANSFDVRKPRVYRLVLFFRKSIAMNILKKVACKVRVWQERRRYEALPAEIRKDIGWRQASVNCVEA